MQIRRWIYSFCYIHEMHCSRYLRIALILDGLFMTIKEEKQLYSCRYPNIRRLRLLWWMCCNLSLLCLLHILMFYKILRMVGGQKLQRIFIICIYIISVDLAFCKKKYYELIERTIHCNYFNTVSYTHLRAHET